MQKYSRHEDTAEIVYQFSAIASMKNLPFGYIVENGNRGGGGELEMSRSASAVQGVTVPFGTAKSLLCC